MTPWARRALLAVGAVAATGAAAVVVGADRRGGTSDEPTFAGDVAPILARSCVGCHATGASAPFPLETYADARRRADRIVEATASRRMPPWLPRGQPGRFAGERRLAEDEVATLRAWAAGGAPPGDLAGVEPLRPGRPAWQPSEPDLVLDLPRLTVPAGSGDVYRNLVVPIPVAQTRWVEYAELRPGSESAVHHARMMVDTTDSSRNLDAADAVPGFDGMELRSGATDPDGHFVGWTPGKSMLEPLEGMAWRLEPGTDLVVQVHVQSSERDELIAASVALHFAERPPSRHPAILVIGSLQIDIPAGAADHAVENSFTLPVPVEVLSVYPHAHYLGKDLRAWAVLPDGREVELIHIPDWDFDWQDDYRLSEPVALPAGATIFKRFTFDNSAANPRNPSDPPRRVVYGSASTDEMADLILQVLPRSERERDELLAAQAWQHESEDMAYVADEAYRRGTALLAAGDLDAAVTAFQETLQNRADHVGALVGLSRVFVAREDFVSAAVVARQGVSMSGGRSAEALELLAQALAAQGSASEAVATAEEALRLARASGQDALADSLAVRVERYRAGARR